MARDLKLPWTRSGRYPPLAALTFIVVVLLVFNVSNWRMTKFLEQSKEEDLTRRLSSVARVIAASLAYPVPPEILTGLSELPPEDQTIGLDVFPDTPEYESLAVRIAEMKAGSGLAQVLLLTPQGNVVVDSNYRFITGEPLPFAIDSQYLREALAGEAATTPLYAWEGEHFQRDYQPVVNDNGTTVGVIMCSISADYLQGMRQVRAQVLRLALLSSIILVFLGVWLYRMFRYVARLERRALQKVRVEAMGTLAGGVAHELRNPLAIIRALAEEIEADQETQNRSSENSRDIIAETQRLSDLVSHFLSLSRAPDASEHHPVALNEEIERVVQLMRKSSPSTILFNTDLPAAPVLISGDDRALRQLLLNLLVNAREAIGEKSGLVDIILRVRRNFAELRIRDNGPGISSKELGVVFDPFYTTRAQGTGLGLSISRSIAENFGGELHLESTAGKETIAIVNLPLAHGLNQSL